MASVATSSDLMAPIQGFNTSHPARQGLYRRAIHGVGEAGRRRRAKEKAETDLAHAKVADATTRRSGDPSRTGSLPLRCGLAFALILIDGIACYLAAQVFGGDQLSTVFVTGLLLVGLVAGEVTLDVANRRRARTAWRWTAGLLAAFVVALGVLRFSYLVTVNGDLVPALLGAGLLTVNTAAIVALGCWVLREAETVEMYKQRRHLQRVRRGCGNVTKAAQRAAETRDQQVTAYTDEMRLWLLETRTELAADDVQTTVRAVRQHLLETAVVDQPGQE